jgi:hypothetical protein
LLADWLTSADNSYFARAAVNRMWAHFFGRGLVDPLDELGGNKAPSHPELLDTLAGEFVASGYDLKFLIRAIVGSQIYQRSSRFTDSSQRDPSLFARAVGRGLTPEQWFDSFVVATGCDDNQRAEMLGKFSSLERPAEMQTSILQSLAMMNGRLVTDATSLTESRTLAAVIDAPFLDRKGKIEALFLASLSREPLPAEIEPLIAYFDSTDGQASSSSQDSREREALADIFWALLNSAEFKLNH